MSESDRLIRLIISKLDNVAKTQPGTAWSTSFLMKQFCELGKSQDFYVFASQCEGADGGEWLYDLCWLDYGGRSLSRSETRFRSAPVVLESEWSMNPDELVDDFEKLLMARAGLRVMVFQAKDKSAGEELVKDVFIREIKNFRSGEPGDVYLFCVYLFQNDEKVFRYWEVRSAPDWSYTELNTRD